jgi:hypothetical protein
VQLGGLTVCLCAAGLAFLEWPEYSKRAINRLRNELSGVPDAGPNMNMKVNPNIIFMRQVFEAME